MSTESIVAIISALTAALTALIPLYFREKAKAAAAEKKASECETTARTVIRSIENAGPGPVSKKIKLDVKRTSMERGVDETINRLIEEETRG